jgi:hypothetical protein
MLGKRPGAVPRSNVDGRGTASVRSLPDPDSALDLNDLSQRSVIALVGLAFEAGIAAAHLVARLADAHGLALAAVRVIIDPAHRAVPPAALLAMAPGGSADVSATLREILAGSPPTPSPPARRLFACAARWGRASAGNEKRLRAVWIHQIR